MSDARPAVCRDAHALIWDGYAPEALFEMRQRVRGKRHYLHVEEAIERVLGSDAFGILPRACEGSAREDVLPSGNVLWVDIDAISGVDVITDDGIDSVIAHLLEPIGLSPSVAVCSGGGCWFYWKPGHMVPVNQIERLNKGLASLLGGDRSVDGGRIARSFGSRNAKYETRTDASPSCIVDQARGIWQLASVPPLRTFSSLCDFETLTGKRGLDERTWSDPRVTTGARTESDRLIGVHHDRHCGVLTWRTS